MPCVHRGALARELGKDAFGPPGVVGTGLDQNQGSGRSIQAGGEGGGGKEGGRHGKGKEPFQRVLLVLPPI